MAHGALYRWASSLYRRNGELSYGREIISRWVGQWADEMPPEKELRILDLGAGTCADLRNIRVRLEGRKRRMIACEYSAEEAERARAEGFEAFIIDIEREAIPASDDFFDCIIANQVIEHTKEIFFIFSEISRVLRPGGLLVIGVPNLACLHNRLLFLFGCQPVCLQLLGPHIRGITASDFRGFIETGSFFKTVRFAGGHFYPFSGRAERIMSAFFPTLCVSIFFAIRRTDKNGTFIEVLGRPATPYFRGNSGPRNDKFRE